jgi:hypothetical protein
MLLDILSLIDLYKFVWNSLQCFNIKKIVNYKSVGCYLGFSISL